MVFAVLIRGQSHAFAVQVQARRSLPMNNGLQIPGVFSFPMSSLCHSMLDACPGALGLFDPRQWPAACQSTPDGIFSGAAGRDGRSRMLAPWAAGQGQLQAHSRFVAGADDALCGIQVSAFHHEDAEYWRQRHADRRAATAQTRPAVGPGRRSGRVLDGRITLPPGKGMAQVVVSRSSACSRVVRGHIVEIVDAVDALAGCDLRVRFDNVNSTASSVV